MKGVILLSLATHCEIQGPNEWLYVVDEDDDNDYDDILLLLLLLLLSEFSAYFCSSHSFYDKSSLPSVLERDRYSSPFLQYYKKQSLQFLLLGLINAHLLLNYNICHLSEFYGEEGPVIMYTYVYLFHVCMNVNLCFQD